VHFALFLVSAAVSVRYFAFLGCYTELFGSSVPEFLGSISVPLPHEGTGRLSRNAGKQRNFADSDRPTDRPTLRDNPEQRRPRSYIYYYIFKNQQNAPVKIQ
jgi:hypothetical protein